MIRVSDDEEESDEEMLDTGRSEASNSSIGSLNDRSNSQASESSTNALKSDDEFEPVEVRILLSSTIFNHTGKLIIGNISNFLGRRV